MKTVYHWKNIFKTIGIVMLVAAFNISFVLWIGFENINVAALFALFFGVITGYLSVTVYMIKWELFHFE